MLKIAMSSAACGLLRALIARAGVSRDRILLSDWRSVDWQSLTFIGERHHIGLRIAGPNSVEVVERMTDDLENADFTIPGQIVADIMQIGEVEYTGDGSATLCIEALTIAE
jgi:glycine cleavage system aminomethyltransferase T